DVAELNAVLTAQGVTGVTASIGGGKLVLTSGTTGTTSSVAVTNFAETDANTNTTITGIGLDAGASAAGVAAVAPGAVKTVDALVQEINTNTSLKDKIRASNDNGKLRIENLSTEELTVTGIGSDGEVDGTTGTGEIGGNTVRKNLVTQFNELRDQLDKFADDASFNGINLLRGDKLKLTFNETGTSTIDIQAKNENGDPIAINNTTLGIDHVVNSDFDLDSKLDAKLEILGTALGKLRSQASSFGSNLSIVQNRTDFTKNMINTLETGAANLTLADTNEEAANLLALQTRQQLSSTALSMASQADQAVLRLF
ncbi:MAG: flagellar protein, partial [Hyphomicrobiales bacterium]